MTSETTTDGAVPDFVNNPDAMVWAEEFAKRVRTGCDPTDTGWLVAWFANAMACGELNVPATRAEHARLIAEVLEGAATVVHACPPGWSGITPCCGRTPFELDRTSRMTVDLDLVTCGRECTHGCLKDSTRVIAEGPDFRRYTLEECLHCRCRAWADERGRFTTAWLVPKQTELPSDLNGIGTTRIVTRTANP